MPKCRRGTPLGVIEFTIGEQSGVGGDPGTMKLELRAAVEIKPQRLVLKFTRRVRYRSRLKMRSTTLIFIAESVRIRIN